MAEEVKEPDSHIDDVMCRVAGDIATIGVDKTGRNKHQSYSFRPHDEILNVVSPIMARHDLNMTPKYSEYKLETIVSVNDRGESKTSVRVTVKGKFSFYYRGQRRVVRTFGEATDFADKATGKAQTYALKTALIQAFRIPIIGTEDPDYEHNQIANLLTEQEKSAFKTEIASAKTMQDLKGVWGRIALRAKDDKESHDELGKLAGKRRKELEPPEVAK